MKYIVDIVIQSFIVYIANENRCIEKKLIYFLEISIMFISIMLISTNIAKNTYEQCLFFNNIHLLYNITQKSVISQIVTGYICKYKLLLSIIVLFSGKKSVIKNIVWTRDIRYC